MFSNNNDLRSDAACTNRRGRVCYLTRAPGADLARYAVRYWYAEAAADSPVAAGAQFPTGCVCVLFNVGPPQALLDGPGGEATWVSGERARPLHLWSPHGARLIGVAFRPGGGRPFFDRPLAEFTDLVVPLTNLWPPGLLGEVHERMHQVDPAARDAPGRLFGILEEALRLRLDITRSVGLGLIDAAVRRLEDMGPGAPVRSVAADLGVSTRYLRRVFRDDVGLSPKTLHRVLRFQRLITHLEPTASTSADDGPDWSLLALNCGYFDQSHMIREFRDFTEMRPGDYLKLRSPDPNFARDD